MRAGKRRDDVVRIQADVLEDFMMNVFIKEGVPKDQAQICAHVLIESDKRGIESHGISRLKPIYIQRIRQKTIIPETKVDVIKEGPTTTVLDGNHGMGQVVSHQAMKMAIEKAKQFGMGMVAVRNSNHYGIAGYYVTMASDAGLIGITGTNARPSVAPTFGVENMLGTNPITFGMPTDEAFPFVLDCATSLSQRGKLEVYDRLDKSVPPGWVIGEDGETRTDTEQILRDLTQGQAALTPLGGIGDENAGYKGYGYATVVEILSAALQGGAFLKALSGVKDGKPAFHALGHFFIAIDVEAFIDLEEFKSTTGQILRELRGSKKAPGHDRIYTAGEKEYLAWQERKVHGIPINQSLQVEIKSLIAELGLNQYQFGF